MKKNLLPKLLCFCLSGLLLLACGKEPEDYLDGKTSVIEGRLADVTGSGTLRLMRIGENGPETVDSSSWNASGEFLLAAPADTENLFILEIGTGKAAVFMEAGLHRFSGSLRDLQGYAYSNSPLTDNLRKMESVRNSFEQKAQELDQLFRLAGQNQDYRALDSLSLAFAGLQAESKAKLKALMAEMGPGPVTYLATSMFSPDEEFAFLDSLGRVFESRSPKAGFTRKLSRFLEKPRLLAPGKTAPDFTVTDPAGKPVSLSRFRGSWVLLDFWASWCKPCRAESPVLVQAYARYKDKGFTIFSVSLDGDREAWMKAMVQDRMFWAHGSELKGWKSNVALQYGLTAIPASFLLDPEGRIVAKNLRGTALAENLALRIR